MSRWGRRLDNLEARVPQLPQRPAPPYRELADWLERVAAEHDAERDEYGNITALIWRGVYVVPVYAEQWQRDRVDVTEEYVMSATLSAFIEWQNDLAAKKPGAVAWDWAERVEAGELVAERGKGGELSTIAGPDGVSFSLVGNRGAKTTEEHRLSVAANRGEVNEWWEVYCSNVLRYQLSGSAPRGEMTPSGRRLWRH